ncbi:MobF family relaxase [Luteolibacter algae]|uniref:MobF family relaxase n=1 Tax=Luteolibacter algae TaxID=454151 RepID=A0ABW5D7M1_9BACT
MITISQIRNGAGYLSRHLSANDYYSEGERVEGYWLGKGAEKLGLRGVVKEEHFESLRTNRHPFTGEKLTPRMHKVAFHDIVVSAPKAFSIAAIVGQDERLVNAFHESSRFVLSELEMHAAVRVRAGEMVRTEAIKTTGNVACAAFHHDSSRMLGPQLHTHLVIANVSFDEDQQRWMALQPRVMLEASKQSIRAMFHDDLARRAESLGYKVSRANGGFRIEGVSQELEERFSQRSAQRRQFEQRYRELFQREASKERIEAFIKEGKSAAKARFVREFEAEFQRNPSRVETEAFVKDWRSASLKRTSTAAVRQGQLNQLSEVERRELELTVARARKACAVNRLSQVEEVERPHIDAGETERAKLVKSSAETPRRRHESAGPAQSEARATTKGKGKKQQWKNDQERQRLLRQMKRGLNVAQALRGHPASIIARSLRTATRR